MSNRVVLVCAALMTALAAALFLYGQSGRTNTPVASAGAPQASPPPSSSVLPPRAPATAEQPPAIPVLPAPLLRPGPVTISTTGFASWSLMDRRSGEITGSADQNVTQGTASMIKAWLAADYLRRAAEKNQTPDSGRMRSLTIMIRDSDNAAASTFWDLLGGSATITRLTQICGLTDSRAYLDWAHTLVSSRDTVRMADCIGDGRAAGPKWTEWVLNEMRAVRGAGRFGIISALPAEEAAKTGIKNGWIARSDGKWHVNCMAVAPDWSLAVLLVYPANKGMAHGINICKGVTQQLMAAPAG